MAAWIDFKELRSKIQFEAVLRHYGVELKLKGKQHQGFCPLPAHQGKKHSPSFSANLEKGIWQCFGCGAKGNVIDFAARMEGLNPESGADVRKAALLLKERFLGGSGDACGKEAAPQQPLDAKPAAAPEPRPAEDKRPRIINAPLDFRLKHLDPKHPYLKARGLAADTIEHFGLGHCSRGMLADRIAIPLFDTEGRMIGYAGRMADDKLIDRDNPKYKFPGEREHQGTVYEFQKHRFLYRGIKRDTATRSVIVVEGFPSVWWLFQNGYPDSLALMGASCSDEQARLIVESMEPTGSVWIFTDGDDAGIRCAEELLRKISPHRFIRWAKLTAGRQPTDCRREELDYLLPRQEASRSICT